MDLMEKNLKTELSHKWRRSVFFSDSDSTHT